MKVFVCVLLVCGVLTGCQADKPMQPTKPAASKHQRLDLKPLTAEELGMARSTK